MAKVREVFGGDNIIGNETMNGTSPKKTSTGCVTHPHTPSTEREREREEFQFPSRRHAIISLASLLGTFFGSKRRGILLQHFW